MSTVAVAAATKNAPARILLETFAGGPECADRPPLDSNQPAGTCLPVSWTRESGSDARDGVPDDQPRGVASSSVHLLQHSALSTRLPTMRGSLSSKVEHSLGPAERGVALDVPLLSNRNTSTACIYGTVRACRISHRLLHAGAGAPAIGCPRHPRCSMAARCTRYIICAEFEKGGRAFLVVLSLAAATTQHRPYSSRLVPASSVSSRASWAS